MTVTADAEKEMKTTTFLVCLLLALSSSVSGGSLGRVWGGEDVQVGGAPFVVDVQVNGLGHYCGGFIYNWDWVVTTAGCVYGYASSDLKVVAGQVRLDGTDPGEVTIGVRSIQRHPDYDLEKGLNDIALLQLMTSISQSPNRDAISLANVTVGAAGATVYGWGDAGFGSASANLKQANVTFLPDANCSALYGAAWNSTTMFCAGDGTANACRGDSGGPLVQNGGVVGLVSHRLNDACNSLGSPVAYTQLAPFSTWMATYAGLQPPISSTTMSSTNRPTTSISSPPSSDPTSSSSTDGPASSESITTTYPPP